MRTRSTWAEHELCLRLLAGQARDVRDLAPCGCGGKCDDCLSMEAIAEELKFMARKAAKKIDHTQEQK